MGDLAEYNIVWPATEDEPLAKQLVFDRMYLTMFSNEDVSSC